MANAAEFATGCEVGAAVLGTARSLVFMKKEEGLVKIPADILGQKETPCYIIAEVGLNHNGSFDLACRSVEMAVKCGVDAVKFQNFVTEDFLTDRSITYTYKSQGKEITEPLFDICKRSEFKREWLPALKELCDKLEVEFLSTPTSEQGIKDLVNCGVRILKNGSDYLTHTPLLRLMSRTGLLVILSTGMACTEDIDDAVEAVRDEGNERIVLLHCVSNYPVENKNVNLLRMVALRERYGFPVGFSDHTLGWEAAVQAVTLGACVIEKHFTLDKKLPGPDHWFSANPEEMKTLVGKVRRAETRLGDRDLSPAEGEMNVLKKYRLGVFATRAMKKGHVLHKEDIAIRKPHRGMRPKDVEGVLGKTLKRDVAADDPLHMGNF